MKVLVGVLLLPLIAASLAFVLGLHNDAQEQRQAQNPYPLSAAKIVTNGTKFRQGEGVHVLLSVTNTDSKPVTIIPPPASYDLRIYDAKGELVFGYHMWVDYPPNEPYTIAPNSEQKVFSHFVWDQKTNSDPSTGTREQVPPGVYMIEFTLLEPPIGKSVATIEIT